MSTNPLKRMEEADYAALEEELEIRFGPALAQQIVEEIKKADMAEKPVKEWDYIGVKAISETMEHFRDEAQARLDTLKTVKSRQNLPKPANQDGPEMDVEQARQEFERMFAFYMQVQRSYYRMYRAILKLNSPEIPAWKTYRKSRRDPEMRKAA